MTVQYCTSIFSDVTILYFSNLNTSHKSLIPHHLSHPLNSNISFSFHLKYCMQHYTVLYWFYLPQSQLMIDIASQGIKVVTSAEFLQVSSVSHLNLDASKSVDLDNEPGLLEYRYCTYLFWSIWSGNSVLPM